jgi:hypothetical protein
MVMASLLCLALVSNLSFRVPTTVEAQAVCLTGNGPTFTLGVEKNVPLPGGGVLRDGDLFYLGTAVQFITQAAGTRFFSIGDNTSAAFGTNPGFANTTSLGFAASTPSATATAISCNDSFWDISFSLAGTGTTAGDVITLYFRQPNGTGRQNIVEFTVQADNMSARVTAALAGIDLSAVGHTPTTVGRVIPYEEAAGSAGKRTRLITVALPMNGTVADCNQLAVEVRRAGGTGTTTVALINLLVTRNATSTATGTGLLTGQTGRYPTALRCPVACVACPAALVCDTVLCFAPPTVWCNRLPFPTYNQKNFRVVVPGVNLNQPISVFVNRRINPLISQYLGCGGYMRSDVNYRLIAAYVAAQLDIQNQLSFWWGKLNSQPLGCHWMAPMAMPGMPAAAPALPATFSGGPITSLTVNSSLQDLYDATNWVVTRGTMADQMALLAIYSQLTSCGRD